MPFHVPILVTVMWPSLRCTVNLYRYVKAEASSALASLGFSKCLGHRHVAKAAKVLLMTNTKFGRVFSPAPPKSANHSREAGGEKQQATGLWY